MAVVVVAATAAAASSDEPPPAVMAAHPEAPVVTAGPAAAAAAVMAVAVAPELPLSTQAALWRPAAVSRRVCVSSAWTVAVLPRRASWKGPIEAPLCAARHTSSAWLSPTAKVLRGRSNSGHATFGAHALRLVALPPRSHTRTLCDLDLCTHTNLS